MAAAWNEARLTLFLRGGAVFYVQDRSLTSAEPHFFIVLNHSPLTEEYLLLVVSSSQVEGVKRRFSHLPSQTLVEIAPEAYGDFTKPSIINCNHVFRRTKAQLIEQLNAGGSQKRDLAPELLQRLRTGVIESPMVENEIKAKLQ